MKYVPADTLETAMAMSEALWMLSRPVSVRVPGEVTARLFEARTDAAGGVWLAVIEDYQISVHAEAALNGIADILAGAGVAQAELDALAALVVSRRGGMLTPWEYFPQAFKDSAKTWEQINWPQKQ